MWEVEPPFHSLSHKMFVIGYVMICHIFPGSSVSYHGLETCSHVPLHSIFSVFEIFILLRSGCTVPLLHFNITLRTSMGKLKFILYYTHIIQVINPLSSQSKLICFLHVPCVPWATRDYTVIHYNKPVPFDVIYMVCDATYCHFLLTHLDQEHL